MSTPEDPLLSQRKRLAWRASRRGIKEMDIIVGGFAEQRLPHMSAQELNTFQLVLDLPDQQLLAWVTKQEEVPENMREPLLMDLLQFRPTQA
jgi:antitoxin CptB